MKLVTARHSRVCWLATFANQTPSEDPMALRNLSYGLYVVTARDGDRDYGCIANTVFQVGATPTQMAISSQMGNLTREIIEKTGKINVSVLTESVPFEVIRHFGMQSGRDVDKFADGPKVAHSCNGLAYLTEYANAMFSVEVKHTTNLGSHMLFVGDVTESKVLGKEPSCTYAYYHSSIKPKF